MFSWYDEVDKIKAWIDQNVEQELSLAAIAEFCGYSAFYLSKKFHEIEGIALKEYLRAAKMQHAAHTLHTTDARILDIALRHGYSSQEAFSRAFAQVFRVTPHAYRKLPKPSPTAEKSRLLHAVGYTTEMGGTDMKIHVEQMYDWNCYALYAEEVEPQYWDFFRSALWWQVGNSFIKTYDNVADFEYCAENFTKYGELSIRQQLKLVDTPWEKALDFFIPEMESLGVSWHIHGSVAMALWGIDVAPKDVNIIVPNCSDFDKVRSRFCKLAIVPIERCGDWVMSGGGTIFHEASIGIWFHNKELEPFDMSTLARRDYKGKQLYVSTLEMLRQDNEHYGRAERVGMIDARMRECKV